MHMRAPMNVMRYLQRRVSLSTGFFPKRKSRTPSWNPCDHSLATLCEAHTNNVLAVRNNSPIWLRIRPVGHNYGNKHGRKKHRYASSQPHSQVATRMLMSRADRNPLPHLLAIRLAVRHQPETQRRRAKDRRTTKRNPRKGTPSPSTSNPSSQTH